MAATFTGAETPAPFAVGQSGVGSPLETELLAQQTPSFELTAHPSWRGAVQGSKGQGVGTGAVRVSAPRGTRPKAPHTSSPMWMLMATGTAFFPMTTSHLAGSAEGRDRAWVADTISFTFRA